MINDHVVSEPGILSLYQERGVRAFDLVMNECFNAKEREFDDWRKLLREADKRFRIVELKGPEGSRLQIIEAVWESEEEKIVLGDWAAAASIGRIF